MTLAVTMRIRFQAQRAVERRLTLGQRLTLGRNVAERSPERVVVPGRWLGVAQDSMVSANLLRLNYHDEEDGRAVIGWRTRAQHHPTSIRFRTGVESDLANEGRVVLGPGQRRSIVVTRLSEQKQRFVDRFVVELECVGSAPPTPPELPTGVDSSQWRPLCEHWWDPRREAGADRRSWQRVLTSTGRQVRRHAPERKLALATAEELRRLGDAGVDADAVRRAWTRAMGRLAHELLNDLSSCRPFVVHGLAVPNLAEYLDKQDQGLPGQLPAGELQIRQLVVALPATGLPEWQW